MTADHLKIELVNQTSSRKVYAYITGLAIDHNNAWFLATCPKAEFRNGKSAVEDATRACELTGWKEANNIDIVRSYSPGSLAL